MRKSFLFLVAVLFTANIAWAEKPVPPAEYYQAGAQVPTMSAPSEVHLSGSLTLNQPVRKIGKSATTKKVEELIAETEKLKRAVVDNTAKLSENTDSVKRAGDNLTGLSTVMENLTDAVNGNGKTIRAVGGNLGDQIFKNAWLMGILGLIAACFLGVTLWRRIGASEGRVINAIRTSADNVSNGVTQVNKNLNAVAKTVDEVHSVLKKDASPFTYEVDGRKLDYAAAEEIDGSVIYRELYVPKGATGNAAEYERNEEDSRSKAGSNFRRTMKRYFAGDFDSDEYKLQREVIEHYVPAAKEIQ
ncbi:MAG: hypothetical protein WCF93_00505 [Candidatus Moraniibacteriota bacterium]